MKAQRVSRDIAVHFLEPRNYMGVGGRRHAQVYLPPGITKYPLYRRLGGHQGRSRRWRKNSPPPCFEHRTDQPVANRYKDYALQAQTFRPTISSAYFPQYNSLQFI
jgi:hypothetical protein